MRVTTTAVGTRSVLALVAVFVLHAYRCHSLKSLVSGTRFAHDTVVIPPMVRTDPCHASHYICPDRTTSSIRVCQYKGLCDCIDSYELLPLVFHSLVLSARGLRYMSRRSRPLHLGVRPLRYRDPLPSTPLPLPRLRYLTFSGRSTSDKSLSCPIVVRLVPRNQRAHIATGETRRLSNGT